MRAMVYRGDGPALSLEERPVPEPGEGEVLVRVSACGVCRTDLHVVDGDLTEPRLPVVPGHEIVGRVAALGAGVERFSGGERVGIPWLGWTCGICRYCRSGRENLCPDARFTGYTLDGGYGDYCIADERYCFPLPGERDDAHSAPLLCAGLIGYRALAMAGDAERLGLYGFGAAAHIIAQVARAQGRRVFAFVRPGRSGGDRLRPRPRRRMGRRIGRNATGGAGRGTALRARGRPGAGGAPRHRARRHRGLRRHPHERHSRHPLTSFYGGSGASSRSPTSRGATARNFWGSPRGQTSRCTSSPCRSPRPT